MKFVVTRPYGNEVEVKLHWETKEKIKKIAYYGSLALGCGIIANKIVQNKKTEVSE